MIQNQFNYNNMMFSQNYPQFNPMMSCNNQFWNPQPCMPMYNNFNTCNNMCNNMNQTFNQNMMMNNICNNTMNPFLGNTMNIQMNNFNYNNMNINNNVNNINFQMNNLNNWMNNINLHNIYYTKTRTSTLYQNDNEDFVNKIELLNQNTFYDFDKNKKYSEKLDLESTKEIEKLAKKLKIIKNKLDLIFCQENLSKLKNERDLLNFFTEKEKECIEFVNNNYEEKEILNVFVTKEIKKIFEQSPQINNLSKSILEKLKKVELEKTNSVQDYNGKLMGIFGVYNMPDFLTQGQKNNLEGLIYYTKRNTETINLINQVQNNKFIKDSQQLILLYESIKKNENLIFEGINGKFQLLYFFIAVNYSIFNKNFCHNEFFQFLKINTAIIKEYFSDKFDYVKAYNDFKSMNKTKRKEEIETLFSAINIDINNKKETVLNIIASFYYLLFDKFKSCNLASECLNIGITFINVILKNFVIALDQRFNKKIIVENNFYELLKDLNIYYINKLINLNIYPRKNEAYSFYYIDSILINNNRVKEVYLALKDKYNQTKYFSQYGKLGPGKNFTTFEEKIELIPFEENLYSNHIVIFVDGFLNENSNPTKKCKDFMSNFKKECMFYYFRWPSDTLPNIVWNCVFKLFNWTNPFEQFRRAALRAKICGKILAYIIYSNTIFKNFQISLVGFSLGNHVIKHCIKELNRLNNNIGNLDKVALFQRLDNNYGVYLKNVIFCAAATTFNNINRWKNNIYGTIVEKLKNCFSDKDWVLYYLYRKAMDRTAIGIKKLDIIYEGENQVDNYDFTRYGFDHKIHGYDMNLLAKKISGYYKDI